VLNNPLSGYWLGVNVLLDTILGVGFFVGLVWLQPRVFDSVWNRLQRAKELGRIRRQYLADYGRIPTELYDELPHEHTPKETQFIVQLGQLYAVNGWLVYTFLTILVWFGVIGITLTLLFVKGMVAPTSWGAIEYDLLYVRANAQPNGAHVWSYFSVPAFCLLVAYKLRPKNLGMLGLVGDIYQGVGAAAFMVAMHEGLWNIFYYATYYKYLSWVDLNNVLRDVSFCVMAVLFILAFWKYPKRTLPLKIFIWPTLVYLAFLFVWLAFGLPITTINNPSHSIGLYQETVWFSNPWVNLTEVFGWILIASTYSYAVLKVKVKQLLAPDTIKAPHFLHRPRKSQ
jgi:hypothetical protein